MASLDSEEDTVPTALSPADSAFEINDATFCAYIKRLKDLHNFLYQEAVPVNPVDAVALEMGNLSALSFHPSGRAPTVQEWNQVERQTQAIFLLLTPALRRKFLMGGTPWMVAWLPAYFLGAAGLSLFFAVITIEAGWPIFWMLLVYLIWLATLGAVGALAFIGMNALSIQDDITFDLTNKRLMLLRIALGALFAVVLTLPFGYAEFIKFCARVAQPFQQLVNAKASPDPGLLTREAIFLILPFVLGFSTSLVILILNQFIEAVQAFFGRKASPAIVPPPPATAPPPPTIAPPPPTTAPPPRASAGDGAPSVRSAPEPADGITRASTRKQAEGS